jgi:hypothetical protein
MKVIVIGAGTIGSISTLQEVIKDMSIDDVVSIKETKHDQIRTKSNNTNIFVTIMPIEQPEFDEDNSF